MATLTVTATPTGEVTRTDKDGTIAGFSTRHPKDSVTELLTKNLTEVAEICIRSVGSD